MDDTKPGKFYTAKYNSMAWNHHTVYMDKELLSLLALLRETPALVGVVFNAPCLIFVI